MKKILFLFILLLTMQPFFAQDTDSDGIADVLDLDSDNDGILDAIEGRCATEAFEGFDSPLNNNITNGAGQNRGTTFKGWTTQNGTKIMTIRVNGTSYTPGPDNAQSGTQYIDMNNAGDYMYM